MKKTKLILVAVVLVVVVAGFMFIKNEGYLDTILAGDNSGGNGDTNPSENNGGSSTDGNTNTDGNHDGRFVGNWTFVDGTSSGQPVTHITSGWVNYKADGTWSYFFDYGYTTVNAEGTWQAKDGTLYWGTNGNEISDWYSVESYQFTGDNLILSTDTSEMRYTK